MASGLINDYGACNYSLDKTSLLHDIYRSLLNNGRTYAAFEKDRIAPLLERLKDRKEILDPMSGYGSLLTYCAQSDFPLYAYNVEFNAPSYFWQIIIHPKYNEKFIEFSEKLLKKINVWPKPSLRASISDNWFPEESIRLLKLLWSLCLEVAHVMRLSPNDIEFIPLSFILPFIGRLSAIVQGNVVTHVKAGGICVYHGWQADFEAYIKALLCNLKETARLTRRKNHHVILGDSKSIVLPKDRFSAMITSPPYPNSRDYSSMFAPENAFINLLKQEGLLALNIPSTRLIGSPRVSEKEGNLKRTIEDVQSPSAKKFIKEIGNFKSDNRTKYDNEVYYIPYYCNYFSDIEKAYENIAKSFKKNFEGYIIVVNNTARKKIIPVAEAIIETWTRLGFNARKENEYTREISHVGGINPGVKGLTARHMEYTIKIWRI